MYEFKQEDKDEKEWINRFTHSTLVDGVCLLDLKKNNEMIKYIDNIKFPSVDINAEKLGFYATKLIINRLEEQINQKNSYIIETKFIERKLLKKLIYKNIEIAYINF